MDGMGLGPPLVPAEALFAGHGEPSIGAPIPSRICLRCLEADVGKAAVDIREVEMEQLISRLLGRYENGALSRRELVGTLALLSVGTQTASAAEFQSSTLNHVSI